MPMNRGHRVLIAVLIGASAFRAAPVLAQSGCAGLPTYAELQEKMIAASDPDGWQPGDPNRGLRMNMWGTIVKRDGVVCAVVFTGDNRGDQWPGSRVISAQKANTANAFSLDSMALSTAQLYGLVQPGGSLFGLQESNP